MVIFIYVMLKMRNYKSNKKIVFLFVTSMIIAFVLIFNQALISVLHDIFDNRIVNALYETINENEYSNLINKFQNIFKNNSSFTKKDERFYMYNMTYKLIVEYPWGLGNSNWLIQSELYKISGVASHTHNFLLQWYLRFGVLTIVILYPLLRFLKGLKYKTTASLVLMVFVINQTFGYGLWNMKYLALMIIFYVINEKEIVLLRGKQNENIQ